MQNKANKNHKMDLTTQTIAVVNQKGGVGKTTTTVNLASTLAIVGKKVLIVDFDPQGNSSASFALSEQDQKKQSKTIYHTLCDLCDIKETICKTQVPNLDIITSNIDLAAANIEFVDLPNKHAMLHNALNHIKQRYDYIFIDCPPALGLLTLNALKACDSIIIPMQCEFFSLDGLVNLLQTIKLAQAQLNPALTIKGILLTMSDKRNRLTREVEREVRDAFGSLVFHTVIPRNVKLSEAPSHAVPAILYDDKCSGSFAYLNLTRELLALDEKIRSGEFLSASENKNNSTVNSINNMNFNWRGHEEKNVG